MILTLVIQKHSTRVLKMIKIDSSRDKDDNVLSEESAILERLKKYYDKLLNVPEQNSDLANGICV